MSSRTGRRAGNDTEADAGPLVVDRRTFLAGLGIGLGGGLALAAVSPVALARGQDAESPFDHVLLVSVSGDVTVYVDKSELGQGVYTALPALVAEELELPWERVRVETLVLEGARAAEMVTAGSGSVRTLWRGLRALGATAREMLVAAAAERWGVPVGDCHAEAGRVRHPTSGRSLGYADLAAAAGARPVPAPVALKPARDFALIGRPLARLDTPLKVTGEAVFGTDITVPDMLHAAVRTSPVFGGTLVSMDEAAALALPGVRHIARVPGGVAVCADRYWQAHEGLEALAPRFEGGDVDFDSESYSRALHAALDGPGVVSHRLGDPGLPEASAPDVLDVRYEVPFLAHAAIEPMNCTANVEADRVELWAPTQGQTRLRNAVAEALALSPERVKVNTTFVGGGFGRRFVPDFAVQAALISRSAGRPVKLIWSREEDMRHGFYRPAYAARIRARIGADGAGPAVAFHVAGPWYRARNAPSWLRRGVSRVQLALGSGLVPDWLPDSIEYRFPRWVRDGWDNLATSGLDRPDYAIEHRSVAYTPVDTNVPIGWWRSVGASQTVYFLESFIDELAYAGGLDPLDQRLALLAQHARGRRVVEAVARLSGWRERAKPEPGRGQGLAYVHFVESFIAMVAVVRVDAQDRLRVERIDCVVDCGQVVNPDIARAQIETGAVFALSAALYGKITLDGGAVVQSNYADYRMLLASETPEIRVEFIESDADPGGLGELSTPPVAPAVCNAIFAASGRRVRKLPILEALGRPADEGPWRG